MSSGTNDVGTVTPTTDAIVGVTVVRFIDIDILMYKSTGAMDTGDIVRGLSKRLTMGANVSGAMVGVTVPAMLMDMLPISVNAGNSPIVIPNVVFTGLGALEMITGPSPKSGPASKPGSTSLQLA